MTPALAAHYHDALSGEYALLTARYQTGSARDGAGLLFVLRPGDPEAPLNPAEARFITRRNWTEYVLATRGEDAMAGAVEAIELVATAIDGALPPLSLPVVVVAEEDGHAEATLLIVSPPRGACAWAVPPSN